MTVLGRFASTVAALRARAIARVRRGFEWAGFISSTQVTGRTSPDHPDLDKLPAGILHIVGGPTYRKWAYLVCPCGCGECIMLSLATKGHPRWQVKLDWLLRPTVEPSVWQTTGCCSHFWIRRGRIEWTTDTGIPPRRGRTNR